MKEYDGKKEDKLSRRTFISTAAGAALGADMENVQSPGKKIMHKLRKTSGAFVSQIHHCTRCRSDAKGLL